MSPRISNSPSEQPSTTTIQRTRIKIQLASMLEREPRGRAARHARSTALRSDRRRSMPRHIGTDHGLEMQQDLALTILQFDRAGRGTRLKVVGNLQKRQSSAGFRDLRCALRLTSSCACAISLSLPIVLWSKTLTTSLCSCSSRPNLKVSFL